METSEQEEEDKFDERMERVGCYMCATFAVIFFTAIALLAYDIIINF